MIKITPELLKGIGFVEGKECFTYNYGSYDVRLALCPSTGTWRSPKHQGDPSWGKEWVVVDSAFGTTISGGVVECLDDVVGLILKLGEAQGRYSQKLKTKELLVDKLSRLLDGGTDE